MMRYVYLCENSLEGIFSAVYKAYEDKHSHTDNRIQIHEPGYNQELFCEYRMVKTDYERAVKVARTIRRDISYEAYEFIQRAAASYHLEKADAIYRFIIEGLKVGKRVMNHLTAPFMQTLFELDRNTGNEIHYFIEFLRFEELENGALFGRINPKSEVLPYVAEHFADRFSGENWIIADTVHDSVVIHKKNQGCMYAVLEEANLEELTLQYSAEEKDMQRLWKLFVDTIAIRERTNTDLQRQMLPFRFRKYMKEFQNG
ncbi:MAG: TIGR03915 family putative DNA repair protein [Lachnospiraceae bacterium]|nr:TIGR03915 family putative DNA repair protein [Lachnospiraceae bacterium]